MQQTNNFTVLNIREYLVNENSKLREEKLRQLLSEFSYSLLCRWFKAAVLPLDKELYSELFKAGDMRRYTVCGATFASSSNSAKYCPDCRKRITRKQAAESMRKRRTMLRKKGLKSLAAGGFPGIKV